MRPEASRGKHLAVALGLAVVVALVYGRLVVNEFGVTDDWRMMRAAVNGHEWSYPSLASGRPLLAVFVAAGFAPVEVVGDLSWLRAAALLGVAALAYLLYRTAERAGWAWWASALLGILVVTTPPFQCLSSWAICFSFPWSAALTVAAYRQCQLAADAERASRRWLRGLLALALLSAGGMIYQNVLPYVLVPLAIDVFGPRATRGHVRRVVAAGVVLAASLALCFVTLKIGTAILPRDVPPGRGEIYLDLATKLAWFAQTALQDSLNLWNLFPTPAIALWVGVAIVVGMVLAVRGKLGARALQVLFAAALLPMAYAPNLITLESWSAYRTQIALVSLVAVYAFVAVHGLVGILPRVVRTPLLVVVLFFGAELTGIAATRNVRVFYVEPHTLELRVMRRQMTAELLRKVPVLRVAGCPYSQSPTKLRYDEFGVLSTSRDFSVVPMTSLVAREMLGEEPKLTIISVVDGTTPKLRRDELFVNMRRMDGQARAARRRR